MNCRWTADELSMSRSQNRQSTAPQHRSTAPLTAPLTAPPTAPPTASAKTLILFAELPNIWKRYTLRCSVLERQILISFTLSCIIIVVITSPYLHLHQGSNNFAMSFIVNIAEHIMLTNFSKKSVKESQIAYVNHRKTRHHQESSVSKDISKLIHKNAILSIDCMQCGNPLTKFKICSNLAQ